LILIGEVDSKFLSRTEIENEKREKDKKQKGNQIVYSLYDGNGKRIKRER